MIASSVSNSSTKDVERYLEQVPGLTGLEPEFDRIVEDPSLSRNNPAATGHIDYGTGSVTEFVKNPYSFQMLEDGEKLSATVHEVLEEKQFNGFIGDELKSTHGISDEFKDFLNYAQTEFPNSIREGMTQALTNKLLPEGDKIGRRFYPKETDIFESIVEGLDFDLEDELLQDKETGYSLQVEDYIVEEGFYYEKGSLNGQSYSFMAIGEEAGYKGHELAEKYVPGSLQSVNRDYLQDVASEYETDSVYIKKFR